MTSSSPKLYIIKVGNIGYYKIDKKSKVQTVVQTIASCTKFNCQKEVNELLLQFSVNLAIRNRGIKLDVLCYDVDKKTN